MKQAPLKAAVFYFVLNPSYSGENSKTSSWVLLPQNQTLNIILISTTRVTSAVIGTKTTLYISFYTGQSGAKAKKLSDKNKMVWI